MQPHAASTPIPQALASVSFGATFAYGALAVTPLIGDDEPACDYLTLDEALARGLVQITEVSDAGTVPELRVVNRAAKPVLIIDGQELVGAKQNRVINLTVLVAAARDTVIPVSCVEAGRWHHASAAFVAAPRTQFASGRAEKMAQVSRSLSTNGARRADQGAVWDAIAAKASRMQAHSDTSAMAAMFEQHTRAIDEYVERLGAVSRQRGAVFSVHGRTAGLELFDRADVCCRLMPKLVRSYAIDAVEPVAVRRARDRCGAARLVALLRRAQCREFPAIGEGSDVRMETKSLVGAALVAGGRVVHLAAFTNSTGRSPRAVH